jgi:septin family protein
LHHYIEKISPSNKNNKNTDFENLRNMVLTPFIQEIIPLTNNYTNQKYTKILETTPWCIYINKKEVVHYQLNDYI